MSVYKRGETYGFKFTIDGQLVRESVHTDSKSIARDAERARRRQIEQSVNGIIKRCGNTLSPLTTDELGGRLKQKHACFGRLAALSGKRSEVLDWAMFIDR